MWRINCMHQIKSDLYFLGGGVILKRTLGVLAGNIIKKKSQMREYETVRLQHHFPSLWITSPCLAQCSIAPLLRLCIPCDSGFASRVLFDFSITPLEGRETSFVFICTSFPRWHKLNCFSPSSALPVSLSSLLFLPQLTFLVHLSFVSFIDLCLGGGHTWQCSV